ncbi:SDR family NAD(P)-dependent oxidoreductase [Micromonospora andamanensis]|uniref:Dehydrogenase/reductase n=1 Tax=Micromonospora andamanensis TaxID=1287068 RepID=A0ABQ4HU64_9ACTN|nr:SDR family NAD(P)-dependent oxidoreductase [Micromonospora andamanensis]GIJ09193.1 putative dehydrogenase/reductase [Micromonospora andamanensis]
MTTIVMTGGTSGIGEVAARRLATRPGTRVFVGARGRPPRGLTTLPLDLASLDSVRSFARAVGEQAPEIDALVLNAGTSQPDVYGRTVDGFETTFAVNHLAHYLLLRLLLPRLAYGADVILTTSGTHNPAEQTILPPPRHADARLLAHPDEDPELDRQPRTAAGRAYATSKLCAILTARALAAQPEAREHGLSVVAYDPGPTPGTRLMRATPLALRAVWWLLGTPLRRLVPRFNSKATAGRTLAELALGEIRPPAEAIHAALRRGRLTWPAPSDLALRDDLSADLWHDSGVLVGLPSRTR